MPQNAVLLKQGLRVGRGKTLDMFVVGANKGLQRPCLGHAHHLLRLHVVQSHTPNLAIIEQP